MVLLQYSTVFLMRYYSRLSVIKVCFISLPFPERQTWSLSPPLLCSTFDFPEIDGHIHEHGESIITQLIILKTTLIQYPSDEACRSFSVCHSGRSRTLKASLSLPALFQSDLFLDARPLIQSCNTHSHVAPPHLISHAVPRVQELYSTHRGVHSVQQGSVNR